MSVVALKRQISPYTHAYYADTIYVTHTHTQVQNYTNAAFLKGPCATRTIVLPYRVAV